jgi:ABC-type glutathione transport system ATPase component
LLADEPTANLSPTERDSVLELLQSLAKDANVAVLITGAHALEVMCASPIFGIEEGKLVTPSLEPPPQIGEVIEFPHSRAS